MKTSTKLIGFVAFGLVAFFLYKSNKENEGKSEAPTIQGLNVDLKPDVLIDSILPHLNFVPNHYKPHVGHGVKRFIAGYMAEKNVK
jgi:hypothetical protein